jgi:5-formyltetrahydrofolate cyclo-ligase
MKADKEQLRQTMREEAKRHSAEERAEASRQICERIRAQEIWKSARKILLFVPTSYEPDMWPLIRDGKQVSLPAFNVMLGHYEPRDIKEDSDLIVGQFGIREPKLTCPLADNSTLDLVLAPGIAFTLDGTRLGRGKGYYDRLLEKVRTLKIGICFDWQVLPRIPRDGHDVLMDYLATPMRWHRTTQG